MEKLSMCRICLIKDVRLHCLVKTHLQEIYELLSGNLLETKDTRPLHACYMCCARLHNCLRLRAACLHSEELFSHLLENNSWEVTPSQGMNMLQTTPVMNMDVCPVVQRELKMEPLQITNEPQNEDWVEDLQDDIIDQGISGQFIKEEDIKSENESSDDKDLDYSIQNIEVESNSASDNSYVGDGIRESYVSKSNHGMSSVDLQDIHGKNVKIVSQQMDSNNIQKATTVTEQLKPTYLEDTSQSTNLNNGENKEMLRPDICEEYKQIVHTTSETNCSINSDLFKHIRTHTGEKPYKCNTCGKEFIQNSDLSEHIRKKPHKCNICGKCFRKSSTLLNHTHTHTGGKPYKCDTCGRFFRLKKYLSQHIRTHIEQPYKCDICGKCFRQYESLLYHTCTRTAEKPYKCDTCGKCFRLKNRGTCCTLGRVVPRTIIFFS